MAYTTNPYCVLADVKLVLGSQSTANDALITSLIPVAQKWIDDEVGYPFQSDGPGTTRTFSGSGGEYLLTGWLSVITQVKEVSYAVSVNNNGFLTTQMTTQLDITLDCEIGPENHAPGWKLERVSETPFYKGRRNYMVTGTWGYGTIPPDINRACARLVAFYVKMKDTNYSDVLIEQGAARQKYLKSIPQDILDDLKHYRARFFYSR